MIHPAVIYVFCNNVNFTLLIANAVSCKRLPHFLQCISTWIFLCFLPTRFPLGESIQSHLNTGHTDDMCVCVM